MNRSVHVVFATALLAVLASYVGLVVVPQATLGRLSPIRDDLGDTYPLETAGRVAAGRRVYISLGCQACHTQQVRAADLERGWGSRPSFPRDYLHDWPPLLGTSRTGPDLSNIGVRQPSVAWHLLHLYDPRTTTRDSTMPPYEFLFECRPLMGERPLLALSAPPARIPPGVAVTPTTKGISLVAYLRSLKRDVPLPEAGSPRVVQDPWRLGARTYTLCTGCHGHDGRGVADVYPALAGSEWAQHRPEIAGRIVLHGMRPSAVPEAASRPSMPAWHQLSDESLSAVLTYVRGMWGNHATAITPDQLAALRERTAGRRQAWTRDELVSLDAAAGSE